jgi:hypothetical protein
MQPTHKPRSYRDCANLRPVERNGDVGARVHPSVLAVMLWFGLNGQTVPPSAGYLKGHQVTKCPGSRFGDSFVVVPSLRRRSVGPPPSAIHGRGRLSRHPCRSAHCTPPAFSLHPSRVLWCLDCRVQEQCWLELRLVAFLDRASISLTPLFTVGARLPAICREPAARPAHAGCQAPSSRTSHAAIGTASTCALRGETVMWVLECIRPYWR